MFATGIKIVKKNYDSYIVTNDSMCEPETVEVWNEQRDTFVQIRRDDIFADICNGAYVASVRHNVTGFKVLENNCDIVAVDIVQFLMPVIPVEFDDTAKAQMKDNAIAVAVKHVAKRLGVDWEDKSLNINNSWFFIGDMVESSLHKALKAAANGNIYSVFNR